MQGAVSRLHGSPTIEVGGQLGQLLLNRVDEALISDNERLLGCDQAVEPIDRLADHGRVADELQELFGRG